MKLTYFRSENNPNFGDELNPYIWPKLLPDGFLDSDERELFIGIGSTIYNTYPDRSRKIVLGAGYGGYTALPNTTDGTWDFIFVRGPQSARLLKLPDQLAVTDSAVLIRYLSDLPSPSLGIDVSFIPHFGSLLTGVWDEVCHDAGIKIIDPRRCVEDTLSDILGSRLVICEAMHGAIVADALRIPWIAVKPINKSNHMKWWDWAASLDIDLKWAELYPSNLLELMQKSTGRGSHLGRAAPLKDHVALGLINRAMMKIASERLKSIANLPSSLSSETNIKLKSSRAR